MIPITPPPSQQPCPPPRHREIDVVPVIIYGASGARIYSATVAIVPERDAQLPQGMKVNHIMTRAAIAKLIRQWREDPQTQPEQRRFPTVSDLFILILQRTLGDLLSRGVFGEDGNLLLA